MSYRADVVLRKNSCVGEGPIWDVQSRSLLWVDVREGKVMRFNPSTLLNEEFEIGKHVGAVALTDTKKVLVAAKDEFLWLDLLDSTISRIAKASHADDFRFNDGRVDVAGRFVVGTMGYSPQPGTASLYSFSLPGNLKEIISGVGLSNGLCWNQENSKLFYIDTLTAQIARYEYDAESGEVRNREAIIKFEPSQGSPDGMTIDVEGNLWVGFWGGGCIRNISQTGEIIREVEIPVSRVTSAAFGGDNLNELYVTTASYQLTAEELANQPLAGSLFVIETQTQGLPEHRISVGI